MGPVLPLEMRAELPLGFGSRFRRSGFWFCWFGGCGVPDFWGVLLYKGEAEVSGGRIPEVCEETELTNWSVRLRDAWMFLVRTSRTSLKFTPTSASFPWRSTTTFLLCSPSCSVPLPPAAVPDEGRLDFWRVCKEEICWFREARSCFIT